jgi:hypothetical protein
MVSARCEQGNGAPSRGFCSSHGRTMIGSCPTREGRGPRRRIAAGAPPPAHHPGRCNLLGRGARPGGRKLGLPGRANFQRPIRLDEQPLARLPVATIRPFRPRLTSDGCAREAPRVTGGRPPRLPRRCTLARSCPRGSRRTRDEATAPTSWQSPRLRYLRGVARSPTAKAARYAWIVVSAE